MTTLPLVGAGGATPTLPEPATHLDTTPWGDAHPAGDGGPDGTQGGRDALALFSASHDMHPLARQQQQQHQAFIGHGAQAAGAQKVNGCKVPDAATRVWDVANTTQAEIDALKNSCDPKEQRLGRTIEHAKAAYGDLLVKNPQPKPGEPLVGAKLVVTLNAGNGSEPVITLMGKGFDPKLHARVHTHYHGDNATVGDPVGSKAGQNSRIRETIARDPQTVFVLPECRNAKETVDSPKNDNYYAADWGNVKSQARTTDLALEAAGITKVGRETVSVHSRGGEVIEKLMGNDKSGNSLRAHRLELHDSLYGSQDDVAAWGRTENGKKVEKVIYVHGTNGGPNGDGRDREIAKTFKGAYIRIEAAPIVKSTGEPRPPEHDADGVRKYHHDPHYQTTGRYLAIWPLPGGGGS